MDAKTLEALKASIAKWERNAEAKTPDEYLIADYDCPLCCLFIKHRCIGCPVSAKAGESLCYGTPYRPACRAWCDWNVRETAESQELAHSAARDEVAFLKSLLPEEPQS